MSDYKYEMQMEAEDLAVTFVDPTGELGIDGMEAFYSLSDDQQTKIFLQAEENWVQRKAIEAEAKYDKLNDDDRQKMEKMTQEFIKKGQY